MDEITKTTIDTCANMLVHTPDFDDSRQAFSLDELNDKLYDYIDMVTDAYITYKNSLREARKYTVAIVLTSIMATIVTAGLIALIVLACMHIIDTITAVVACVGTLATVVYAILQADTYTDKRKHYKMLADSMRINITDLYVSVAVITWPLTHKEDRPC